MKPALRSAWRGAASAEWLVVAPAVLAVGFGVLQWALLMHGRASVEYAAFQGARAGATRHAEPGAITEGIAIGMIGIRDAMLTAAPVSLSGPAASAILADELASGVVAWRQRRPASEDFDDWAQPALDEEGRSIEGLVEIPNDNLRYRGTAVGSRSGRSLVESNLLEIELVYAWPMRVPLIGSLAVRWMEWFDRCAAAAEPAAGLRPWGRADWRIEGGAWRCRFYRAGGVPRWPLRVLASARMHSPARHAGSEPVAAGPALDPAAGEPPPEPAAVPVPAGPLDSPTAIGAVEIEAAEVEAAEVDAAEVGPVDVSDRADISQPGECFAESVSGRPETDSGQPEMDVGNQEAALVAAVESLAAEAVAVQAR